MNAAEINININININQENADISDTDTIPEESPEYYEPISNGDDDSSDQNSDDDHDYEPNFHRLPNGVQNGIDSLDLSDEDDDDNDEEQEQEEERRREAAFERAFLEDGNRRRAPLTQENATRVMQAMRGISFGGSAPDWAGQVPEDRWIDQLSVIRQPPPSSSSTSTAS